jgi:hypothetical protein
LEWNFRVSTQKKVGFEAAEPNCVSWLVALLRYPANQNEEEPHPGAKQENREAGDVDKSDRSARASINCAVTVNDAKGLTHNYLKDTEPQYPSEVRKPMKPSRKTRTWSMGRLC